MLIAVDLHMQENIHAKHEFSMLDKWKELVLWILQNNYGHMLSLYNFCKLQKYTNIYI